MGEVEKSVWFQVGLPMCGCRWTHSRRLHQSSFLCKRAVGRRGMEGGLLCILNFSMLFEWKKQTNKHMLWSLLAVSSQRASLDPSCLLVPFGLWVGSCDIITSWGRGFLASYPLESRQPLVVCGESFKQSLWFFSLMQVLSWNGRPGGPHPGQIGRPMGFSFLAIWNAYLTWPAHSFHLDNAASLQVPHLLGSLDRVERTGFG